jgi:hypothetical protein
MAFLLNRNAKLLIFYLADSDVTPLDPITTPVNRPPGSLGEDCPLLKVTTQFSGDPDGLHPML